MKYTLLVIGLVSASLAWAQNSNLTTTRFGNTTTTFGQINGQPVQLTTNRFGNTCLLYTSPSPRDS